MVLFDQIPRMANLYIKGPDVLTEDGQVIGDGIQFHVEEHVYEFVGRVPIVHWIQFHADIGDWNVGPVRDDRSPSRPPGKAVTRMQYRFQGAAPDGDARLEQGGRAYFHGKLKLFSRPQFKWRAGPFSTGRSSARCC